MARTPPDPKLPPHNLDAEMAVLGSLLLDGSTIEDVAAILQPGDFYSEPNGRLFEHISNCPATGAGPIDPMLLVQWLTDQSVLEEIGGAARIAEVTQSVPYAYNVVYYAQLVKAASQRRNALAIASDALNVFSNGNFPEALAEVQLRLGHLAESIDAKTRFQWLDCQALISGNFKLEFLVENVLAQHQPGVIAGSSKSLKTSVMIDLAVSLASQAFFLGKFKVKQPYRVGIMSGESGMATIQNCYRRVCEARTWEADVTKLSIWWCESVANFSSLEDLHELRRFIRKQSLEVLMVDPLYQALPEVDAASLAKMGEVLRATNQICHDTGCTLILVHHTIKRPGFGSNRSVFEPLEREDIHGAGINEWMRQWLLINRREVYAADGTHKLNLVLGGSAGHSSRWALDVDEGRFSPSEFGGLEKWEVSLDTLSDAREQVRQAKATEKEAQTQERVDQRVKRILDALVANPDGLPMTRIRDLSGGPGKNFTSAWEVVLATGEIEPVFLFLSGKKTSTEAYRLKR